MILFVDLLNTIIQSFIVSYFPYYLSFNNENDRISKKHFVISIIGIFFTSMLATNIFSNGNITTAVIATMNIVIICLVYRHIYKKALLAYFIGYFLVQITAILVTSIIWPTISNVVSDAEASMLLGIYIPAIILELLIIKNKDNIKMEVLRHTIFSAIMLGLLCISSIIEILISTNILKNFIKYF